MDINNRIGSKGINVFNQNNDFATKNSNIVKNIENISNEIKNFSSNDINILKDSISLISPLENNIQTISNHLLPLNETIMNTLSTNPTSSELPKMINEYATKIEKTNTLNRTMLNGNYDIPNNNVIKNVRIVSNDNSAIDNSIAKTISSTEIAENEIVKENFASNELFNEANVITNKDLNTDEKINWQSTNLNNKELTQSSFFQDDQKMKNTNENKVRVDEKQANSIYSDTDINEKKFVFKMDEGSNINNLKDMFFEHKQMLDDAAKNYRIHIDTTIRLNEDLFSAKNVISHLDSNMLTNNGVSLSTIYANLSSETLNNLIQY